MVLTSLWCSCCAAVDGDAAGCIGRGDAADCVARSDGVGVEAATCDGDDGEGRGGGAANTRTTGLI